MAKRFTDTDKWKREWFSCLDPKAKLVWIYILDQCDYCGIWPRNFTLLSQQTGLKVDEQTFSNWFQGKIIKFDADKFFIPSFFEFQYGSSKEGFRAKQSAINTLVKLGLMNLDLSVNESQGDSPSVPDTPSISESVSIGVSNSLKENDKNLKIQIDAIYALYPLKKGKQKGLTIAYRECTTQELVDQLRVAVNKYLEDIARRKTAPEFIKHFSTFMASWRDWLDDDAGTTTIQTTDADLSKIFGEGA